MKVLVSLETYFNKGLRKNATLSRDELDELLAEEEQVKSYQSCLKKITAREVPARDADQDPPRDRAGREAIPTGQRKPTKIMRRDQLRPDQAILTWPNRARPSQTTAEKRHRRVRRHQETFPRQGIILRQGITLRQEITLHQEQILLLAEIPHWEIIRLPARRRVRTRQAQAALQARELKKNGGEKFGMKPFHRLDESKKELGEIL